MCKKKHALQHACQDFECTVNSSCASSHVNTFPDKHRLTRRQGMRTYQNESEIQGVMQDRYININGVPFKHITTL